MWKRAASASIKTIIKHDFIMDVDIKELLKTVTENLDLSKFRGDVVGVKYYNDSYNDPDNGYLRYVKAQGLMEWQRGS